MVLSPKLLSYIHAINSIYACILINAQIMYLSPGPITIFSLQPKIKKESEAHFEELKHHKISIVHSHLVYSPLCMIILCLVFIDYTCFVQGAQWYTQQSMQYFDGCSKWSTIIN